MVGSKSNFKMPEELNEYLKVILDKWDLIDRASNEILDLYDGNIDEEVDIMDKLLPYAGIIAKYAKDIDSEYLAKYFIRCMEVPWYNNATEVFISEYGRIRPYLPLPLNCSKIAFSNLPKDFVLKYLDDFKLIKPFYFIESMMFEDYPEEVKVKIINDWNKYSKDNDDQLYNTIYYQIDSVFRSYANKLDLISRLRKELDENIVPKQWKSTVVPQVIIDNFVKGIVTTASESGILKDNSYPLFTDIHYDVYSIFEYIGRLYGMDEADEAWASVYKYIDEYNGLLFPFDYLLIQSGYKMLNMFPSIDMEIKYLDIIMDRAYKIYEAYREDSDYFISLLENKLSVNTSLINLKSLEAICNMVRRELDSPKIKKRIEEFSEQEEK